MDNLRHDFSRKVITTIRQYRERSESVFTAVSTLSQMKLTNGIDMAVNFTTTIVNHAGATLNNNHHHHHTVHSVILDCSAVLFIDKKGIELLGEFEKELTRLERGPIQLLLAGCNESVLETMRQHGFFAKFEPKRCFVSVQDAVAASSCNHSTSNV